MVELTDREKKIILIKFIMHGNSPFSTQPVDIREKYLIAAMQLLGYEYQKDEMLDLGEAILAVQQNMIESAGGFLKSVPAETVQAAMRDFKSLFRR